jgi:cob(I)alamin adenosyltransferase
VRELQLEVSDLQRKQHDMHYLKEELANKEHNIKILQETIKTLNRDN